jgi:hypothetical protein
VKKSWRLVHVVGPGATGGAFVGILLRSAAYAAPPHPRKTAIEAADKRDPFMPLIPPHPILVNHDEAECVVAHISLSMLFDMNVSLLSSKKALKPAM